MIETEAKIKLTEKERTKLEDLLGKPHAKYVVQRNFIYDLPHGFLRARFERPYAWLTYKGKRKPGKFNSRTELEFLMHSEESPLLSFLSLLGFKEPFYYEKKRANFEMHGCVVSLDKLPNDTSYLEVEGYGPSISSVLKHLNLHKKPIEKQSYVELLRRKTK